MDLRQKTSRYGYGRALIVYRCTGKQIPNVDAEEKARGRARYINELKIPHMLFRNIFYSRFPHAEILETDPSRAKEVKGGQGSIDWKEHPIN